ncbi:MAG: DNA polymerase III subunit delta' [Rickettsiales bacterium]|jgi:DNA polymerase-3 subunit delta'|nr:DNA polymerase III subunit delta' [Rickettsiales bacterium]
MLVGHDKEWQQLLTASARGTLPHGLLISGARGIGKGTLARQFALHLLSSGGRDESAVLSRMKSGGHSDFLLVEQEIDPKKDELKAEISVEQAREVAQFLSMTPGESSWRVVIIDSIDNLNVNAANAILKILEEPPPQSILMLISHTPGRLLPTIRSRCRSLKLAPLSRETFHEVMRDYAPELDIHQRESLGRLSDYSPGVAAQLSHAGALETYASLLGLLRHLPSIDHSALHSFADKIGSGSAHQNWQHFSLLALVLLSRLCKAASGISQPEISDGEQDILISTSRLQPAAVWALKWQQTQEQLALVSSRHLDAKQAAIAWVHGLSDSETKWLVAS